MPSAVCLPQTASPLDLLVVACETQQPTKISNYHDAPASKSTMSDLTSVTPRTVSPVDEIIVLFGERSNQPTKKRSRQRLSNELLRLSKSKHGHLFWNVIMFTLGFMFARYDCDYNYICERNHN